MVWRSTLAVLTGLIVGAAAVFAQTPPAASTTDRADPFVRHAEQRYQEYLDSEKRGDVAAYKRVRTRQAYEGTLENLQKMGKRPSDLGPMLKEVAARGTDLAQFTFVRSETRGPVARLVYQREAPADVGEPRTEVAIFMMRWEDGAWRIGSVGHAHGPKESVLELLFSRPHFALE